MADKDERPIIIKKIKKGGHGHHGGAWKVAYADFVTAMMAFFLLLWLLNATTEEQRSGIADFFTPTVGIAGAMGIGVDGGISPTEDGSKKSDKTPPGIIFGAPPSGEKIKDPEQEKREEEEKSKMEKVEAEIKKEIEADKELGQFKENLLIERTPEGLKIQLIDQDDFSMFERGSSQLSEKAKILLEKLSAIIQKMPNRISITGHTDAARFGTSTSYGNWELSAERANSTRRFLMVTNMDPKKVAAVTGKAEMDPLNPREPLSPVNRRISIILLYRHLYPYETPAPAEMLKPDDETAPAQ